jgi:hypothetical protein
MKARRFVLGAAAATGLTISLLATAGAQDAAGTPEAGDAADPKSIWQAGLQQLAGHYTYLQVASPGGLWERFSPGKNEKLTIRQVSINEVPEELRKKLTQAEIIISDLRLPGQVEASERTSPSGRGKLRFYTESAAGRLQMRNLPGIGGRDEDPGDYTGPVVFHLLHQSHSNPSVTGVLQQRINQEITWGAATLDFADFAADAVKPGEAEDAEGLPVIGNCRTLRSGMEIFAFIEWKRKTKKGDYGYFGTVRLIRKDAADKIPRAPVAPTPSGVGQRAESRGRRAEG